MFEVAVGGVPSESIVWTVPVGLEGWRSFLEHGATALGAEDIVSETKILVQKEGRGGDPLVAIFALNIAWVVWCFFCFTV